MTKIEVIDKALKPESLEEKHQSFLSNPEYLEHWMYVWELKALLDKLRPDDWVIPNRVNNLAVERENEGYIGYIDFCQNAICFHNGEKDYEPFLKKENVG